MSNNKQYLDYEGLTTYHSELVNKLADLEYEPKKMFDDIEVLLTPANWGVSKYGRVAGLKTGLIVTVDSQIWQLENPTTFRNILISSTPIADKIATYTTPESLGWKVIGNTVDFNIADHTLQLSN